VYEKPGISRAFRSRSRRPDDRERPGRSGERGNLLAEKPSNSFRRDATKGVNMAEEHTPPAGPDFAQGVALSDFTGESLLGHVGDQEVLLVRSEAEIFAIDAHCSHYHGPLAEGLVVGESIRCPWHHACFDLRTGEASRAPALTPLAVCCFQQPSVNLSMIASHR